MESSTTYSTAALRCTQYTYSDVRTELSERTHPQQQRKDTTENLDGSVCDICFTIIRPCLHLSRSWQWPTARNLICLQALWSSVIRAHCVSEAKSLLYFCTCFLHVSYIFPTRHVLSKGTKMHTRSHDILIASMSAICCCNTLRCCKY